MGLAFSATSVKRTHNLKETSMIIACKILIGACIAYALAGFALLRWLYKEIKADKKDHRN